MWGFPYCLGEEREIEGHKRRECRGCKAAYQREWRKTPQGQFSVKAHAAIIQYTQQEEAKKEVYKEVRAGRMPRAYTLKCADCGIQAWAYDHRDYAKPLDVAPVCRRCNARRGPGLNRE